MSSAMLDPRSRLTPLRAWLVGSLVVLAVTSTLLVVRPADAQTDVHVFMPGATKTTFRNFDGPELTLGDGLASRGPLLDATRTDKVGSSSQECTVVRQITDDASGPGGLYRCSYILHLADGDLIVEGRDPHGPGVYTFVVVGGTGSYAGSTGEATLTDSSDGTDVEISLP
jgi:hypothetical protein